MNNYEYQILRYVPDRISGEFVNIGLALYNHETAYLKVRVTNRIERLSHFFPETDGRRLKKTIRFIENGIQKIAEQLKNELRLDDMSSLDDITRKVLPKDDSALIFTDVKEAIDINFEAAFEDLFDRLINKHQRHSEDDTLYDKDVWQKMYKEYFEKYGIAQHLKSHIVHTRSDRFEFEHAFKNGKWNLFEPVTFDLKKPSSIKDKVYKWDGKISELKSAGEELKLYLLSKLPSQNSTELSRFISMKLNTDFNGVSVKVITPDKAEAFVREKKRSLEKHNS